LSFDASVDEPTPEVDDEPVMPEVPDVPDVPEAPVPDVPELDVPEVPAPVLDDEPDVSVDDGVVLLDEDDDGDDEGDDDDDGELIEPVLELELEGDGEVVVGDVVLGVVVELELDEGVPGDVPEVSELRLHAVRPIAAAMASTANGLTFIRVLRSGEKRRLAATLHLAGSVPRGGRRRRNASYARNPFSVKVLRH